MYLRFGNNPNNVWEIKNNSEDRITAIYRGRLSTVPGTIDDVDDRGEKLQALEGVHQPQ